MPQELDDDRPASEAEVRDFQSAAADFLKERPDAVSAAEKLRDAGFKVHPTIAHRIVRTKRPDFLHWLASEAGEKDAHALLNVADDSKSSADVFARIPSTLDGLQPLRTYEPKLSEVDTQLRKREADIKSGKRKARR